MSTNLRSHQTSLSGCGTALVTPFTPDGELDLPALSGLVHWQIESGIRLLVLCGSTGEAPTLSEEEQLTVFRIGVETAAGRAPIFAGCTHNSTRDAVARVKRISAIAGVSGILTANPYYNKPTQEGQYQHFRAICNATELPVMVYNVPGRTCANLEPRTVVRLIDSCPNLVAIKEASGNITQISELLTLVPRDFAVFSGDDSLALAVMGIGGAGVISVVSNQIPAEMAHLADAALRGDLETARQAQGKYWPLMQANFWETNPGPVKCVLAMMGRISESYRLPMVPVEASTRKRLEKLASELRLIPEPAVQHI